MKILAIRLARFGDVVLLLPALTLLKSHLPESSITFLTDHRLAPLAEMCPAIDEIIAVNRIAMRDGARWASVKSMRHVVKEVRRQKFDITIDFHGFRETNLLTWLSGALQRIGLKRSGQSFLSFCFNLPPVSEDKNLHAAEMFLRVVQRLGASDLPASRSLIVPANAQHWAKSTLPQRPFAAIYVDAPTPKRIWPPESFASLAGFISRTFGLDVVAISGPNGAPLLDQIRKVTQFSDKVSGYSNLTIPQLAAVVESAQFWISNDTGPMHLGPALGVPTLALFSIGLPEHFRPTGIHDRFLQTNPIEQLTVDEVVRQVTEMWTIARRGLRR